MAENPEDVDVQFNTAKCSLGSSLKRNRERASQSDSRSPTTPNQSASRSLDIATCLILQAQCWQTLGVLNWQTNPLEAKRSLEKGITILTRDLPPSHQNRLAALRSLAAMKNACGLADMKLFDSSKEDLYLNSAGENLEQAMAIRQQLLEERPLHVGFMTECIVAALNLSGLRTRQNKHEDAIALLERCDDFMRPTSKPSN